MARLVVFIYSILRIAFKKNTKPPIFFFLLHILLNIVNLILLAGAEHGSEMFWYQRHYLRGCENSKRECPDCRRSWLQNCNGCLWQYTTTSKAPIHIIYMYVYMFVSENVTTTVTITGSCRGNRLGTEGAWWSYKVCPWAQDLWQIYCRGLYN